MENLFFLLYIRIDYENMMYIIVVMEDIIDDIIDIIDIIIVGVFII